MWTSFLLNEPERVLPAKAMILRVFMGGECAIARGGQACGTFHVARRDFSLDPPSPHDQPRKIMGLLDSLIGSVLGGGGNQQQNPLLQIAMSLLTRSHAE